MLRFNRQGYMLNDNNSITPVVHQYDRCGYMSSVFLKNALKVKFERFYLDVKFSHDESSRGCQNGALI